MFEDECYACDNEEMLEWRMLEDDWSNSEVLWAIEFSLFEETTWTVGQGTEAAL